MTLLKFSNGNAKLTHGEQVFSLPAGHACPFASECLSFANRETGRITDGPNTVFRCFAASGEAWAKSARAAHWHNYDLLKACPDRQSMVELIQASLPGKAKLVRIHASGDFYSMTYFEAWIEIAKRNPSILFYAYTKALALWTKRLDSIPANLKLTASHGGTHDHLIATFQLKSAVVVNYPVEAESMGLAIDHDDTHAWQGNASFALLIHGTQKAGSIQAKAWSVQRQAKQASKASK